MTELLLSELLSWQHRKRGPALRAIYRAETAEVRLADLAAD
jgi:hypothetical protein